MDVASETERMINSFVSQYKDLVAGSDFDNEEALLNACDILKSVTIYIKFFNLSSDNMLYLQIVLTLNFQFLLILRIIF